MPLGRRPLGWSHPQSNRKEHRMDPKDVTFEKPQIVDHGDLTDLTAAAGVGNFLDAAFPDGTPRADLTFSTTP